MRSISVTPWRALIALAYMSSIVYMSSMSGSEIARFGLRSWLLNLGHVPLFGGLAALTFWAMVGPRALCALLAGVICLIFAATDEWHQQFVPGRVPAFADLVADAAGILFGIAIISVLPEGWRAVQAPQKGEQGL